MKHSPVAGLTIAAALGAFGGADFGRRPGFSVPVREPVESEADTKKRAKRKAQGRARLKSRRNP